MNAAGVVGAGGTLALLLVLQWILVLIARKYVADREVIFWDLVVTTEDERYSLSRLQLYMWFVTILISYGAIYFAQREGAIPDVPEELYILMGVITSSTVASTVITFTKKAAWNPGKPNFFIDVFFDSKNSLDLPRTQMFAWTIVIIVVYLVQVFRSLGDSSLPRVPAGLIVLMGISNGAYLGTKAAEPVQPSVSKPELPKPISLVDVAAATSSIQWTQATSAFADLVTKARQSNPKPNS